MTPTHEQFRKVGVTIAARNYPLSPRAQGIVALHNGVASEALPDTFRYAPNRGMQAWLDMLGANREAGKPFVDIDGRLWTVSRMMAA